MDLLLKHYNRKLFVGVYFFCCCLFAGKLTGSPLSAPSKQAKTYIADAGKEKRLNAALRAFKNANGNTNAVEVSRMVDVFKESGKSSEAVISLIVSRLRENDPLYQNRGPKEVELLRGYILASLSKIGINGKVIPVLKSELSFGYHPYQVAAAARVSAMVEGPQQATLVPLLSKYLDENFKDDYVDLDNYGNFWPLKQPTSVRLEIINALSKIGNADGAVAIKALKEIADAPKGSLFNRDHQLVLKAKAAIEKIGSPDLLPSTPLGNNVAVCDYPSFSMADNNALTAVNKRPQPLRNFKAADQNGNVFKLQEAFGRPFMISFFYTRCDNPNKCSNNVSNLATLQQKLVQTKLADKIVLLGITYDPQYDGPAIIKSYGEGRGANFDENFKFLTINSKLYNALIKDMGVLVNYGKGMVNNHGTQLYLFDKKGQLAKVYENTIWKNEDVIHNIQLLQKEDANKYTALK